MKLEVQTEDQIIPYLISYCDEQNQITHDSLLPAFTPPPQFLCL